MRWNNAANLRLHGAAEDLDHTEIEHLDHALAARVGGQQEHVVWLDVAMHHTRLVRVAEGAQHLAPDLNCERDRQRPRGSHLVLQSLSVQTLSHEVGTILDRGPQIRHHDDVRMTQPLENAALAEQAPCKLLAELWVS